MSKFRYCKRMFLAPAGSGNTSYIVAEVESSQGGEYSLGTNMLTVANCQRQIELEFFLGNARERKQSLARAKVLKEILTTFYEGLREEAALIEKKNHIPRKSPTKKP